MIDNPPPWPNGARCAVAFSFDMDADSVVHVNHRDRTDRELHAVAYMRYDPLVAVPRLTTLFAETGVPVSWFVPGWVAERYPHAVEAALARDQEVAHHGYSHAPPNGQSEAEERHDLERGLLCLEAVGAPRPRGYRAPYYALSERTIDLLVEYGFDYDSSLFADDVPIVLDNGNGTLLELPVPAAVDDYNQYVSSRSFDHLMTIAAPEDAARVFKAEFDAMWEHGGLWVSVWHPAVSGRPSRAIAIRDLIEYMQAKGDVWFATHAEVCDHVRGLMARNEWSPRVDRLPY